MNTQKVNKRPRLPLICIIIFALTAVSALLYIAFRVNMNFADAFNRTISPVGRMVFAKLTGWIPFSLAEMLLLLSPVILVTLIVIGAKRFCGTARKMWIYVACIFSVVCMVFNLFVWNFAPGYYGKPLDQKNKSIFGNPYAQFVKATAELRQLWKIDNNQYIATRIMAGAIHSYGNSEYAPYSEQFYIGGSNSLRAFTVRSVGPGSYRPDNANSYTYLDETGTFKLELNAEYRFRIIADLHGALFVDAGNIWLLKKDKERPGGEIRLKDFPEQIALNTGVGVRYDLGILVVRVDFGLGLHAPYDTGRKGYFNLNPFKDGFAWHFAIGYPF